MIKLTASTYLFNTQSNYFLLSIINELSDLRVQIEVKGWILTKVIQSSNSREVVTNN